LISASCFIMVINQHSQKYQSAALFALPKYVASFIILLSVLFLSRQHFEHQRICFYVPLHRNIPNAAIATANPFHMGVKPHWEKCLLSYSEIQVSFTIIALLVNIGGRAKPIKPNNSAHYFMCFRK